MMDPWISTFYAFILWLTSMGILVIAKLYDREVKKQAEADAFWQSWEPNFYNNGTKCHLFTEEDELHQQPLLPDDYRDWNPRGREH